MNLTNKTIVITGGTSGIGYQLVSKLYTNNKVIVIARPSKHLDRLSKQFIEIETFPANLAQPLEYEMVIDQIIKKHHKIDLLINNAAIQNTPTYLDDDFDYDKIHSEINVNFLAVCSLSYLFLPAMLDLKRKTVILNVNSGLALAPKTNSAVYSATKAAINVFSQALAFQLENTNIQVSQAFLPLVETPMTQGRGKNKLSAEFAAEEILNGIESSIIINNIGKVKLLRLLLRFFPRTAQKIMKRA